MMQMPSACSTAALRADNQAESLANDISPLVFRAVGQRFSASIPAGSRCSAAAATGRRYRHHPDQAEVCCSSHCLPVRGRTPAARE
jgi:hypothetical protein